MAHSPPRSHFRRLEMIYADSAINHTIPSQISIERGLAQVTYEVAPDYWHAADGVHGALYFKGLDDAAFFAANSMVPSFFVLTVRFEVELLAQVRGSHLRAIGRFERRSGRKVWAKSELFDEQGQQVARGHGLFVTSDIPLVPQPTGS
ncbi:MAG: PaaI family thioesterase [Myxococcota bacterium]|nr:PaaI family thioesterase [Myxococcota bacterium]